ncbi:MAG: hypothetical protein RSE47_05245, partial [Acidaminococcaceae bacterium]
IAGGVGSSVLELLNQANKLQATKVLNLGIPDLFVPHGDKNLLLRDLELDEAAILRKIKMFLKPQVGEI